MKSTFTFLGMFLTITLFGQADFTKYQDLIDKFSHSCSTPQIFEMDHQARAGVELTHNLDSIVSKFGSFVYNRLEMQYNENGTTRRIDEYALDSTNTTLRHESIYTITHNDADLPSSLLVESLNEETQQFEESIGIVLSYDGMDRTDSVTVSTEDPFTGSFGPLIGLKYVYSGGHLVQTRQWLYISLFGSWVPGSITDFQYDGQDRLVEQQTSVFDFLTMDLNLNSRTTYGYNGNGLTDTVNTYLWLDPMWVPEQRSAFDYYGNDAVANQYDQLHDGSNFVNSGWTHYPVEEVDDFYPINYYMWDVPGSQWSLVDSTSNLLNPTLLWSQVAAPTELGVLAVLGSVDPNVPFLTDGAVTDEIHYFLADTILQPLLPAGMDFYHYSLRAGSGVAQTLPEYVNVQPNPAQDHFSIFIDQDIKADYIVYSSNGTEIRRGVARQGANTVETANWPQGMYYVIMTFEDGRTFAHKQLIQ